MNKTKLAICMKDLEYQTRFVNCFMNHYKNLYELHVFSQLEQLKAATPLEYAVIITGEYTTEEMTNFVERGEIILYLSEWCAEGPDEILDNYIRMEKYQEVYKIAEMIERLTADRMPKQCESAGNGYEMIGVYSLSQEAFQIPFAALLGKIYGEQEKVLLLDLQNYSGLREDDEQSMGLEDLLSVVMTGNYSRSRLLECIRHEADWDYVYPVQNNQCLAEGNRETYEDLIKLLVKELGYKKIIINFGAIFLGQLDMMEQCRQVYLLGKQETGASWREEAFSRELAHMERTALLQKIKRIEIPVYSVRETSWRVLMEKWNWGTLAEGLRSSITKEGLDGPAM